MAVSASEDIVVKKHGIRISLLLVSAAIAFAGFVLANMFTVSVERPYSDLQKRAAERMQHAELAVAAEMQEMGIPLEAEDLNGTWLMGPEFTELTTTPGNVDAKRSSLNPNFAAAMVRYYIEGGLESGDTIAIGTSGSFPGLLIAALSASTEMGLEARVIASCGASMHGATRPDYNIFDILSCLERNGICSFDLLAVSPGGSNDDGGSVLEGILYSGTKELSMRLCLDTGKPVLDYDDMADNIHARFVLYGDDIDMFVNVGGASPNCGTSSYTLNFPQGLVMDPPTIPTTPYRGLNYEYAARGIPVINLLNVKQLAQENGIAYDPVPMELPGEGGAYYETEYNSFIIIASIVLALIPLVAAFVDRKKNGNCPY